MPTPFLLVVISVFHGFVYEHISVRARGWCTQISLRVLPPRVFHAESAFLGSVFPRRRSSSSSSSSLLSLSSALVYGTEAAGVRGGQMALSKVIKTSWCPNFRMTLVNRFAATDIHCLSPRSNHAAAATKEPRQAGNQITAELFSMSKQ